MAKYLDRTCPKCKDYLGVVVPEPPEPAHRCPLPPLRLQVELEGRGGKAIRRSEI